MVQSAGLMHGSTKHGSTKHVCGVGSTEARSAVHRGMFQGCRTMAVVDPGVAYIAVHRTLGMHAWGGWGVTTAAGLGGESRHITKRTLCGEAICVHGWYLACMGSNTHAWYHPMSLAWQQVGTKIGASYDGGWARWAGGRVVVWVNEEGGRVGGLASE